MIFPSKKAVLTWKNWWSQPIHLFWYFNGASRPKIFSNLGLAWNDFTIGKIVFTSASSPSKLCKPGGESFISACSLWWFAAPVDALYSIRNFGLLLPFAPQNTDWQHHTVLEFLYMLVNICLTDLSIDILLLPFLSNIWIACSCMVIQYIRPIIRKLSIFDVDSTTLANRIRADFSPPAHPTNTCHSS